MRPSMENWVLKSKQIEPAEGTWGERPGQTPAADTNQSGWAVTREGDWQRTIDNQIGLRVVCFRSMFFSQAFDSITAKQPTAIFCQSGSKTLSEAMQAAEVLGEALRAVLDKLANSDRPT